MPFPREGLRSLSCHLCKPLHRVGSEFPLGLHLHILWIFSCMEAIVAKESNAAQPWRPHVAQLGHGDRH